MGEEGPWRRRAGYLVVRLYSTLSGNKRVDRYLIDLVLMKDG